MKKTDTWMPLYIGDYLADTSRLTTEQHGAYLLLLMDYWRNGPPPDDEAVLASITKLSLPSWRRHAAVLRGFFQVDDGRWLQGRAESERAKANGVSEKRSGAGKAGAEARWGAGKANGSADGEQMASAMANAWQNDAPSQSHELKHPSDAPALSRKPTASSSPRATIPCPYEEIVARYHTALPELPKVKLMTAARQRAMRKLWGWALSSRKADGSRRAETAEQALEWFETYFARAAQNDFLMGREGRSGEHAGWQCDLDFLLTEKGMRQVIEKTRAA